jgi:hypothetical protein
VGEALRGDRGEMRGIDLFDLELQPQQPGPAPDPDAARSRACGRCPAWTARLLGVHFGAPPRRLPVSRPVFASLVIPAGRAADRDGSLRAPSAPPSPG